MLTIGSINSKVFSLIFGEPERDAAGIAQLSNRVTDDLAAFYELS
jgi:hypothetical protein